jgi:hypothetical protein
MRVPDFYWCQAERDGGCEYPRPSRFAATVARPLQPLGGIGGRELVPRVRAATGAEAIILENRIKVPL